MNISKVLTFLILFFFNSLIAQQNFDPNAYQQFLQSTQNLTTQQLLSLYDAGRFLRTIQVPQNPLYLDSIIVKYNLTNYECSLLNKHGFVVTERLSYSSFGSPLYDIWKKDLPVFISTDAILHALHKSIDDILIDIELYKILPNLRSALISIKNHLPVLHMLYSHDSLMLVSLKDVDVYLTVPMKLLGISVQALYPDNNSVVNNILNLINAQQPTCLNLFSDTPRIIDFSQFTPRGHYTQYDELVKYFKAMMWFGRIELYLIAPVSDDEYQPTIRDLQRQTINSLLIRELIQVSNSSQKINEIEKIIKLFVGEQDNVTLDNLNELISATSITSHTQLLDLNNLFRFQDTLRTRSYAFQRILSQILKSDCGRPDSIVPASAFLLFGQRFIVDSYITSQVVFDRINWYGNKVRRMLPSTLDILFALGNNATAQLLINELDTYKYSSNLARLRYLIDSYDNQFWENSIYNLWLNAIRSLNPPQTRNHLPSFMQTAAFWQEKINTQLTSWTQLRHDFLLYAKQSYTPVPSCSYPYSYVEPIPQFYLRIKRLGEIVEQKFNNEISLPSNISTKVINYFKRLKEISDTLYLISEKQLNNQALSQAEKNFLQGMIILSGLCAPKFSGWYIDLFYNESGYGDVFMMPDYIVADIHTSPADEGGNTVGWIKHCGTGKINLAVVVAPTAGGNIAFIGPVFSYHEFTTNNFLRLTDELWVSTYLWQSTRPSFVNLYLADSTGNSRGEGINLLTNVDEPVTKVPQSILLYQNYPNPFNSSTIIGFTIPEKFSGANVELRIYDVQGKIIKTLVKENLPTGNYSVEWNGLDEKNTSVSSGVYFYKLNVNGNVFTNKMVLMK